MSDEHATSQPMSERRAPGELPLVDALVVVWSPHEPSRLGEVLFVTALGKEVAFGRGDDGDRVFLHRQRPIGNERMPPIAASEVSRKALLLNRTTLGVAVRRGGTPPVRVNGEDIGEYAILKVGDTVEVDRQIMFLYTKRPALMPALRFAQVDMPFGAPDGSGMIGESPAAWALRDMLAGAAQMSGHVLICGESGSGKELAAAAVHRQSARAAGLLVSHNAAAIPAGLVDAELFGNARNYPNPGMAERPGLIGRAHGGTLFLDEIGELGHELQAHLLRVLSGGEYVRLGESQSRHADFRLVAATNRDPDALKHDFVARLQLRVQLPPLRERREDIPMIARAFVVREASGGGPARRFVRENGEPRMSARLVDALIHGDYPLNARDVFRVLSAAILESHGDVLTVAHAPTPPQPQNVAAAAHEAKRPPPTEEQVRAALEAAGGNKLRAAAALGISRAALYRWMKAFGVPQ